MGIIILLASHKMNRTFKNHLDLLVEELFLLKSADERMWPVFTI